MKNALKIIDYFRFSVSKFSDSMSDLHNTLSNRHALESKHKRQTTTSSENRIRSEWDSC